MKSIHSKAFLDLWQALHHESSPGPTTDRWLIDGVEWVRETYRIGTRDYAFHVDTHVLTHAGEEGQAWSLLVVVERWWRSGAHDPLKTSQWCRTLAGQDKQVLAWFDHQRARLDARFSEKRSSLTDQAGN